MLVRAVIFTALLAAMGAPAAGVPAAPQNGRPAIVIRRNVREVIADFRVVGRKGQPVLTLRASQLLVLDNGVPQRVASLRLVGRSTAITGANWRAAGPRGMPSQLPAINLVSIVFGALGPQPRILARRAGQRLVSAELTAGDVAAVFGLWNRLALVQNFTRRKSALLDAVDSATGTAVIRLNYRRRYDQLQAQLAAIATKGHAATATAKADALPFYGGAEMVPLVTETDMLGAMLAAASLNLRATAPRLSRAQLGGLLDLVRALSQFRGRKVVVFFAQRLYVTDDLAPLFRRLLRTANRAEVSFYPVSVSGLSVRTDLAALSTAMREGYDGPLASPALLGQRVLMDELADETGGFATTDTNAPAEAMARIAAAIHTHYELAFVPAGFAPGRLPRRHVVTIRIPGEGHWRIEGRKVYYARFASPRTHVKEER